jgi:hypothetical protein
VKQREPRRRSLADGPLQVTARRGSLGIPQMQKRPSDFIPEGRSFLTG